jgi:6-phosphogluconate dehydrogenase
MKIGIIGLGRMGGAIAYRLLQAGHEVIAFDPHAATRQEAQDMGAQCVDTIVDIAAQTNIVWLMVPAGDPVDEVINELRPKLKAGDIIIDGGNSNFKDSIRRAQLLATDGIQFLDCGTSGGLYGRSYGFCLMLGGDHASYIKIHELLVAIAAPGALAHVGPSGAGHYVKMVHNGIEYGLLQAYAEGFHLLHDGSFKTQLDLEQISRIWNISSVIRSFLLGLVHNVFEKDQKLEKISGAVDENGTGRWTLDEAFAQKMSMPVLEAALKTREWSRETGGNYTTKVIAMMRKEFGGHSLGAGKKEEVL